MDGTREKNSADYINSIEEVNVDFNIISSEAVKDEVVSVDEDEIKNYISANYEVDKKNISISLKK